MIMRMRMRMLMPDDAATEVQTNFDPVTKVRDDRESHHHPVLSAPLLYNTH